MDFIDFGYNYRLPDLQCVMGMRKYNQVQPNALFLEQHTTIILPCHDTVDVEYVVGAIRSFLRS